MQTARQNLPLEVAVLASLLLHAMMFGAWQYRAALARFPLFEPFARIVNLAFLPTRQTRTEPSPQTITFVEAPTRVAPKPQPEPPHEFMETDNSQVTGEQPKDAKYYSDRSTVAANPDNPATKTGETPYLDGTETRMMSTETVVPDLAAPPAPPAPRTPTAPSPAMPSVSANSELAEPAPSAPPAAPATVQSKDVADKGLNLTEEKQLAMLPRDPALAPQVATAPPSPAMANEPALPASPESVPASADGSSSRVIGARKSHLEATRVSRIGVAAFNVADSPFGAYDKEILLAVQSRWYALIKQYQLNERAGEVTIRFQLMEDGTVQSVEIKDTTAGQILALFCKQAIVDSAPFRSLPENLRPLVGNEPREVNFTFYY